MLDAQEIDVLFRSCLYTDEEVEGRSREELEKEAVTVPGITLNVGFHKGRLNEAKERIKGFVGELQSNFTEGWSFLQLPFDKHGRHWCEHRTAEQLMLLAIAAGFMKYCAPKEAWPMLPGGVPYVQTIV